MHSTLALVVAGLAGSACADILWDGRFNDLNSSTDLDEWSWSNQVGPYQYYIHGDDDVTEYVNLSEDYKNPADTGSIQGAKITLTNTSYWEGQTMRRTELIPQTSAAIDSGLVYYHFSISRSDTNPPSTEREHQIAFFESHFTELKYGLISGESGTSDGQLRWDIGGVSQWNVTFEPDVWHNIAFAIDFDADTVAFWHSTGADDLTETVSATTASTYSNGADWHVGVLELPVTGVADTTEDLFFSGVYIESGDLTTSVSGPGSSSSESSSSVAVSSQASTSTVAGSTSSATLLSTSTAVLSSSSIVVESSSAVATSVAATSSAVDTSSFVTSVVSSSSAILTSAAASTTQASASVATSSASASSTATACKRKRRSTNQ